MYLKHLSLENFRLITRLDMNMPRRLLLFVGGNAQGKTTILEAIYYLATFTNALSAADRQCINLLTAEQNPAVTRIQAQFEKDGKDHDIEVRLIMETVNGNTPRFRKEILMDGVKTKAHKAVGFFNAVIYLPQMARLLEGGPDERRRYLNFALTQSDAHYATHLSRYSKTLKQRNALLKRLQESGGNHTQLVYWDQLLVKHGSYLLQARFQAVKEIEKIAIQVHQKLTHGAETIQLKYQPALSDLNDEKVASLFAQEADSFQHDYQLLLEQKRVREIQRGMCLYGPHRDELLLFANGLDLSKYGSRGQIRTAILTLKLSEMLWLKQKTGSWPVLLLDEIYAELDAQRRDDLANYLLETDQTIITTTDTAQFSEEFLSATKICEVSQGVVKSR
ncbi:MAG: DNA replication and repair protein RecF [Anaerolineaceae bacterium]|nr:DNA replication and repair protein RecF [Anaerolineaceae bacterium]